MEAKPKYEDVKKRLRELQSRFDDGLINEFEYRGKSRQLLAQLEPSLPLGYYELRDASDCEVGYLALSISKSSGGFFGMMTLTSGEWEVDDEDPEEEPGRDDPSDLEDYHQDPEEPDEEDSDTTIPTLVY